MFLLLCEIFRSHNRGQAFLGSGDHGFLARIISPAIAIISPIAVSVVPVVATDPNHPDAHGI